ncbi:MAG: hypothetical protein Q9170_007602 [Blastenia crenularia]
MYHSAKVIVLAALATFSSAAPRLSQRQSAIDGYGTFNKYSTQNGINCKNDYFGKEDQSKRKFSRLNSHLEQKGVNLIADNSKIFGAAISDVSKQLGPFSSKTCNRRLQMRLHSIRPATQFVPMVSVSFPSYFPIPCLPTPLPRSLAGTVPDIFSSYLANPIAISIADVPGASYKLPTYESYHAPFCPGAPCAKCYTITNKANQKKITVQIIDACPAQTAWNYCKAPAIEANQRCADPDTAQVDIDESAYPSLTDGQSYASVSSYLPRE